MPHDWSCQTWLWLPNSCFQDILITLYITGLMISKLYNNLRINNTLLKFIDYFPQQINDFIMIKNLIAIQ